MKIDKKWYSVMGSMATFDSKGILNIFKNAKVQKLYRTHEAVMLMVTGVDKNYLYVIISGDYATARVRKKFCKVIG